jgi:hypothetical protein
LLQNGAATLETAAGTPLVDPVGPRESPVTDLAEAAMQLLIGGDDDGNQFLRAGDAEQLRSEPTRWRDSAGFRLKTTSYSIRVPSRRSGIADTIVYVDETQRLAPVLGNLEPRGGSRLVRRVVGASVDSSREAWTITTRPGSIRLS